MAGLIPKNPQPVVDGAPGALLPLLLLFFRQLLDLNDLNGDPKLRSQKGMAKSVKTIESSLTIDHLPSKSSDFKPFEV